MLERFLNTSKYTLVSEMSGRKIMQLLNTKDIDQPFGQLKVLFDYPAPSSFVDYKLVEQLFKNARQFTNKVFKNVEAQIETAKMLGEIPIVPDEEMSALMWKYCKDKWDAPGLNKLNSAQRVDLAKYMKYTYHSSNSQISRITSLPISSVNSLFPLSAK